MRRYTISVNNTTKVVDVEAVGANLFRVQIDGRLVDVTLDDHRDLAHSAITPAVTAVPEATIGQVSTGGDAEAIKAGLPAQDAPAGRPGRRSSPRRRWRRWWRARQDDRTDAGCPADDQHQGGRDGQAW